MSLYVILTGNVGRDAEMRTTPSGRRVMTFSVANDRSYRNEQGDHDEVQWVQIDAWGDKWDGVAPYIKKGREIQVMGSRIDAQGYLAQDGMPAASLSLTARDITLLRGGRPTNEVENAVAAAEEEDVPF